MKTCSKPKLPLESFLPEYNWLSPFRGILTHVTNVYLRNQSNKLLSKTNVTCANTHAPGANILTQNNLTCSVYRAKAKRRGTQLSNIFSTNQIHVDDSKKSGQRKQPSLPSWKGLIRASKTAKYYLVARKRPGGKKVNLLSLKTDLLILVKISNHQKESKKKGYIQAF